jgi:glycosyltransferase involved in cell wall biosynthesis
MKILQVIPVYLPSWQAGGTVQVVFNISKELAKRGHEVYVYTTNSLTPSTNFSFTKKEYMLGGVHIIYFKNIVRFGALLISPGMVRQFLSSSVNFDIVHVHSYRGFQDVLVFLSKLSSTVCVCQPHGSIVRIGKSNRKIVYDLTIGKNMLKAASKVIVLNPTEATQCRSIGIPESKIAVMPNGIDICKFICLPKKGLFKNKFGIPSNFHIILYIGRLHKTKGLDFMINSFSRLISSEKKDCLLVIAGADDGYLLAAKSLVNSLGIENKVLFVGVLEEEDKLTAFVDADVCLYLGPFEPFGIVALEAAASNTPCVVCAGTYMSNVVAAGGFGFSVTYGNIVKLVELLDLILSDPQLAQKMGSLGRNYIFENFSWSNITDDLEDLYIKTIASNT